ncbi:MAG: glycosyltransferase family 2 protein [Pseudomonadota bacterium]
MKNRDKDISIVVPFYNEEESLRRLYDELKASLSRTKYSYEIIFVDDGSADKSFSIIQGLAKADPNVKAVKFMRNFGQTAAMSAGFHHANGRVYVAIDADNQNDPADIPGLMAKLEEGFDVVSGWRKNRKDKFITRRLPSILANRLLSKVTGVKLNDYGCSLKVYRAEYIDSISLYGEMHRFIPAYAHMAGAKVAEIPVNHRARTKGSSKYGLSRIFKVVIDLITVKFLQSLSTKPGYLFGGLGFTLCGFGVLSGMEVILEKMIAGTRAHNNPFLLLAVFLFFLGVQLVLMGLLAELQVRTYHESQNKPTYLVKETLNIAHTSK